MDKFLQRNIDEIPEEHVNRHESYEYFRRNVVPRRENGQSVVSVYKIPPGKAAYPYHYHHKNEEIFYIISGKGLLKTPEGEREVFPGDFLFFPANENGAHKLANISESELLIYIDFDTMNDLEVAVYPDSGKIGIWGKNINKLYDEDQDIGYYEDE